MWSVDSDDVVEEVGMVYSHVCCEWQVKLLIRMSCVIKRIKYQLIDQLVVFFCTHFAIGSFCIHLANYLTMFLQFGHTFLKYTRQAVLVHPSKIATHKLSITSLQKLSVLNIRIQYQQ